MQQKMMGGGRSAHAASAASTGSDAVRESSSGGSAACINAERGSVQTQGSKVGHLKGPSMCSCSHLKSGLLWMHTGTSRHSALHDTPQPSPLLLTHS